MVKVNKDPQQSFKSFIRSKKGTLFTLSFSLLVALMTALGGSSVTSPMPPLLITYYNKQTDQPPPHQERSLSVESSTDTGVVQGVRSNSSSLETNEEAFPSDVTISDEELAYFRKLRDKNPHGSYVILQMLNQGFVSYTRHWICNIYNVAPEVLDLVVFIATDKEAQQSLETFEYGAGENTLNVLYHPFVSSENKANMNPRKAKKSLTYGQAVYLEFMIFRSQFLSSLLEHDVSFFLIEADALWTRNVMPLMHQFLNEPGQPKNVDLVCARDILGQDVLQGGFQLNFATDKSKQIFRTFLAEMNKKLDYVRQIQSVPSSEQSEKIKIAGAEQPLKEAIIQDYIQIHNYTRVFLPQTLVVSGMWYYKRRQNKQTQFFPDPSVILFNFSKGDRKLYRAKTFFHWFLHDNGEQCLVPPFNLNETGTPVDAVWQAFYRGKPME